MTARTVLDELAELKRKVADLERATRVPQFGDSDDLDEGYDGAVILNRRATPIDPADPGLVALLVAQHGWELPALGSHWAKANDFQTVTSSSFVGCYMQSYNQATADAFYTAVIWTTDSGTTGEIRVHNNVVGGDTTDAVTLAANDSDEQPFVWLHGQPIGTGPFRPQIQARRTGGSGNVYIFDPASGHQIGGRWIDATTEGI